MGANKNTYKINCRNVVGQELKKERLVIYPYPSKNFKFVSAIFFMLKVQLTFNFYDCFTIL